MAIYGTISLVVKNIAVSSGEIAFWRVAIALTAILIYKLIRREKIPFNQAKADIFWLALSGIAMGFDWILFFEALKYASVSVTTLSYYFCPVLLMILSPIVFKESLTLQKVLCFVMATVGLVLIIGARSSGGNKEIIGIALALAAAFAYAFIIIIAKRIKSVEGIDKTIFQFFAAIVVLAVYVPLTTGFHASELPSKGLICLGILGLVHTAFAYCLYFTSIGKLPGQKVALLGYIDPLIAVIVSVAFLRETITLWQLVGGAMIIGFTILNELGEAKQAKALTQT
ncbi:MAG: EamA family transporter [Firmicutes bacterium HGW-Firmicutes-16]|nr:MAG: EamA family transporter [Firmicutes bacterium HGW-Firmicutes-16]